MATTDLIRKIRYLKANPRLAELVPQSDMIVLMGSLLEGFQVLQRAIEENKLKGDKGEPGYTPRPGVDYAPLDAFTKALAGFSAQYADLADRIEQKLATVQNGRAGKDAEITEEMIAEVAEMAANLIKLPDFEALVANEITRSGLNIIDAVRLSNEQWTIDDVEGLRQRLNELAETTSRSRGGVGTSTNVVNQVINQRIAAGDIGPSGGSGVTVETPTGTVDASNTSFTVTAAPKWIVSDGIIYFEGAGYSRSSLTITMDVPPSQFIRAII